MTHDLHHPAKEAHWHCRIFVTAVTKIKNDPPRGWSFFAQQKVAKKKLFFYFDLIWGGPSLFVLGTSTSTCGVYNNTYINTNVNDIKYILY